jgi:SAM-dependent methyltransferase
MEHLDLLIDLHRRNPRQGPGCDGETRKALDLARVDRSRPLRVADIGCGTGASTRILARELNARVTAVDFLPEFIAELEEQARAAGVADRIEPLVADMGALPFAEASFDLLWSEGAVYNMGFADGVGAWRRFLRPGGVLVASELTWTTAERPAELQAHWDGEYPEVATASAKFRVLEEAGYGPLGYFVLSESCWREGYYGPLQAGFAAFLERHGHSPAAREVVAAEEREIALYERYHPYYGYGVYVARRVD